LHKDNTTTGTKGLTRTIKTGLIMDMDKLLTKTDFISPLTRNFAQTLSANTTILLPLDIRTMENQENITRDYWWPRMQGQSRSTLLDATFANDQTSQRKNLVSPPPSRSSFSTWEHISIDLITGLPESNGFNAILVIVDRFSK